MTRQIVLEEVYNSDENFTEYEVMDYAKWLGIDPDKEPELLYLARDGIRSQLPPYWKPCQDKNGEIYYFNFSTGQSIWEHPCDLIYKELVHTERARLNQRKLNDQIVVNQINAMSFCQSVVCTECNSDPVRSEDFENRASPKPHEFEQEYVRNFVPIASPTPKSRSHKAVTNHPVDSKLNFEAKLFSNYPERVFDTQTKLKPKLSSTGPNIRPSRSFSSKFRRRMSMNNAKRIRRSSSSEMNTQTVESEGNQESNISLNLVSKVDQNLLNGSGSTDLSTYDRNDIGLIRNDISVFANSTKPILRSEAHLQSMEMDKNFEDPLKSIDQNRHEYGIPLVRLNKPYVKTCTSKDLGNPTLLYDPKQRKYDDPYGEHEAMIVSHNRTLLGQMNELNVIFGNYLPGLNSANEYSNRSKSPTENIRIIALRNYLDSVKSGSLKRVPSTKSARHLLQNNENLIERNNLTEHFSSYDDLGHQYRITIKPFVVDFRQRSQIRSQSWSPGRNTSKPDDGDENKMQGSSLSRNLSCPHIISPTLSNHDPQSKLDQFILKSIAGRMARSSCRPLIGPNRTNSVGPIRLGREKPYLSDRSSTYRSFRNVQFDMNQNFIKSEFKHTIDWDRLSAVLGRVRYSAVNKRLPNDNTDSTPRIDGNANPELVGYLDWLDGARSKLRQMEMAN